MNQVANPLTRSSPLSGRIQRRELIYGIAFTLLVLAVSTLINLQGWKSRIPAFDQLSFIYSAHQFLETGALPAYGDIGSYGSFSPPGTTWLMLPGVMLFDDPRLYEYPGAVLLQFLTLFGVFLLGWQYFGLRCAYLSTFLYGLSEHGLFTTGSLWPIGHPVFYVWVVLLAGWWLTRRDPVFLVAALLVWVWGMNVDLAIAPVVFIIPAAWLISRQPFLPRMFLLVGGIGLVIWFPYLRFDFLGGFSNLSSQLLQQSIFPSEYKAVWCDPSLTLQMYTDESMVHSPNLVTIETQQVERDVPIDKILGFGNRVADSLFSNFKTASIFPAGGVLLSLFTFLTLLFLVGSGISLNEQDPATPRSFWRNRLVHLSLGLVSVGALMVMLGMVAQLTHVDWILRAIRIAIFRKGQILLLAGGVAGLGVIWLDGVIRPVLERKGVILRWNANPAQSAFLVFSLVIPWVLLLAFAEPDKPERFLWLWPLQVLFLAAFITNILPDFRTSPALIIALVVCITLIIVGNISLISKVDQWTRTGWVGQEAEEIQVVDLLAREIRKENKDKAAIGFQTFFYPFMANYHIVNPIYKVGAEFDLLLKVQNNIVNTNQCAEGVSPADEYRIVETRPKPPEWSPKHYFPVTLDDRYQLVAQVGAYQVYKRP
jgi:hypothetical protein